MVIAAQKCLEISCTASARGISCNFACFSHINCDGGNGQSMSIKKLNLINEAVKQRSNLSGQNPARMAAEVISIQDDSGGSRVTSSG